MSTSLMNDMCVPLDQPAIHPSHALPSNLVGSNGASTQESTQVATNVVALIAAFNEARFIGSVVIGTRPFTDAVVVVDDGSSDDTPHIAQTAGAHVLSMAQNGGKGAALQHGLQFVLEQYHPCAIVLLDGDGQHDPNQIPAIVQPILEDNADMVVGSRFLETRSPIPWWRQIGQHGLTLVTNVTSGTSLTDSQSGFRAISAATARKLALSGKGFSIESEMQFAARKHSLNVHEVAISCVYEEPPKRNPVAHGMQVLDGILKIVLNMRPLLFFGVLSAMILIAGLGMGTTVILRFQQTSQLAVGYALITVILIIIGSISMSTGVMLHAIRSFLAKKIIN